jgi:hypothetical protein
MLFYVTFLLSAVNLPPPYIELAYRSANLSILEILGYKNGSKVQRLCSESLYV